MNEQDTRRVMNFKKILDNDDPFTHGFSFEVGRQLIAIIDRLDGQLTTLKEAGEPFMAVYYYTTPTDSEVILLNYVDGGLEAMEDANGRQVYGSDLRRFAQKLKEVKDE